MADRLGIGFVGAGFVTETFHAPSLERVRDADAAGVMNPTVAKAERVADSLSEAGVGDPTAYGDVRDLVRDPDVDALWVAAPNHARVETVEAVVEEYEAGAALAGIAVEKPLARTLDEAERVVDLVESTGLPHAYLENQVHMPGVTRLKELLWGAADEVGRPYLARGAEEHSGPHAAWFWDASRQGGGAASDLMCHSHEVNRYLLSRPGADDDLRPLAVSADAAALKWGRDGYAAELAEEYGVDYRESPAEDYARATVYYETDDGDLVVGEATNSWCFVGPGLRITIELLGPEYSGSVNTLESGTDLFLSERAAEGGYVVEKQAASHGQLPVLPDEVAAYGYLAQNRHVVEAFRRGENAREDLHDGLEVVRIAMATYLAAEEGRRVELTDADLHGYTPAPARGEFRAGVAGLSGPQT